MPYSFGWRTLTDSVILEEEGISVGAGGISGHLGVVHINTDWDKRCCVVRQEEAIPSFRVPGYTTVMRSLMLCLLVISSKICPV